jgi:hypothetical protein
MTFFLSKVQIEEEKKHAKKKKTHKAREKKKKKFQGKLAQKRTTFS